MSGSDPILPANLTPGESSAMGSANVREAAPGKVGAVSATFPRVSLAPDTTVEGFREHVRDGLGAGDAATLKQRLGLEPDASDREVARKLVRVLATSDLARVSVRKLGDGALEPRSQPPPPVRSSDAPTRTSSPPARASSAPSVDRETVTDVTAMTDVRTVLAIARGGRLELRRAAVARIAVLFDERKSLSADDIRAATNFLESYRAGDIAHELLLARTKLPGAEGRRARAEREHLLELGDGVHARLGAFWDGQDVEEPVGALPGDERIQFLAALREMPDAVAAHVGAIIDGSGGARDAGARLEMLGSLRFANDPRLVPALRTALESGEPELTEEAARVLGRTDDPRVRPALAAAYETTHRESTRLVIASALAIVGDLRGKDFARSALQISDASVRIAAMESLGAVGDPEDLERLAPFLADTDPAVALAAIRATARVGDARAIRALREIVALAPKASFRAEIEDAIDAIEARMELRGESAPEGAPHDVPRLSMVPEGARPSASAWARLRALRHYVVGRIWLLFGGYHRAQARFEQASASRPGWSAPLVAGAIALEHRGEYARALVGFRRALEVDRASVERDPLVMPRLLRCFLRRAEQLRSEGRLPIARGLLEEALALDLRWVFSGTLRFEVARLHARLAKETEG
jgi:HEAT repeat protein